MNEIHPRGEGEMHCMKKMSRKVSTPEAAAASKYSGCCAYPAGLTRNDLDQEAVSQKKLSRGGGAARVTQGQPW